MLGSEEHSVGRRVSGGAVATGVRKWKEGVRSWQWGEESGSGAGICRGLLNGFSCVSQEDGSEFRLPRELSHFSH